MIPYAKMQFLTFLPIGIWNPLFQCNFCLRAHETLNLHATSIFCLWLYDALIFDAIFNFCLDSNATLKLDATLTFTSEQMKPLRTM